MPYRLTRSRHDLDWGGHADARRTHRILATGSQSGGKATIDAGYARYLIHSIFTAGASREFLLSAFAKNEQEHENLGAFVGQLRGFFSDNLAKTMQEAGMASINKQRVLVGRILPYNGRARRHHGVDAAVRKFCPVTQYFTRVLPQHRSADRVTHRCP